VKLLGEEDKVEIRRRRKDGVTVMELAVEYGVSGSTIRRAGTGPTEPAPPQHKNTPHA
jgi:predicted transcriptional regulator